MYTITIKTPPIYQESKVSDIIPHLLEHTTTLNLPLTPKSYFSAIVDADPTYFGEYTKIELPEGQNWEIYIQMLCKPVSQDLFERERKTLNEELQESQSDASTMLYKKIQTVLYGASHSRTHKQPNYRDFCTYHQTYYTKENMIVSWENDKLVFVGKKFSLKWNKVRKTSYGVPNNTIIPLAWQKVTTIVFPYTNRKEHRNAFFVYDLIKNFLRYQQRYQLGIYYYQLPYYFHMQKDIAIILPKGIVEIDATFFATYKSYYLRYFTSRYDTYRKIIDIIYGHEFITNKRAKEYITSIDYQTFLWRIKKGVSNS